MILEIATEFAELMGSSSIATLVALFLAKRGTTGKRIPMSKVATVWVLTWVVVFAAAILAQIALTIAGASQSTVDVIGWTWAPLLVGVWFARFRFSRVLIATPTGY